MSNYLGPEVASRPSAIRKRRMIIAAVVVVLVVLLLIFAPALLAFLSMVAFLVALIALIVGRLRWARIGNRRTAGTLMGGTFVLFLIALLVFGSSLPASTSDGAAVATTPSATPSSEPELTSFLGQPCDADELTRKQGADTIHCGADGSGELIWLSQADHDAAEAKAEEEAAAKKAAAEKVAKEKAAAEAKAREEAAAKKAAAEKAAKEKAAKEKAAAEAKAKEEAAAEKAAQERAAAEKAAQERAAAEAAEAERRAQQQAVVPDSGSSSTYYANCSAVRAAGAAPIYRGEPGYSRKLDRDGDGVGCE